MVIVYDLSQPVGKRLQPRWFYNKINGTKLLAYFPEPCICRCGIDKDRYTGKSFYFLYFCQTFFAIHPRHIQIDKNARRGKACIDQFFQRLNTIIRKKTSGGWGYLCYGHTKYLLVICIIIYKKVYHAGDLEIVEKKQDTRYTI